MMDSTCAVWIAGSAADYASTRYAARQGALEVNPIQGASPLRQAALQAGTAAVGCWADARLRRSGRPGLAKGLRIAVLALKLGLAAHNVRAVMR